MPVSRKRKLDKKKAKRNADYRRVVHGARVLAIRGKITFAQFAHIRTLAFGRLNRLTARLSTPQPGAGAED